MKIRIAFLLVLLLISVLLSGDNRFVSASNEQKRIRFQITTVAESTGSRKVLAQTTVEGLPGTDFNINLQAENFKMQARFLSDLVADDKIKLRAKLNTRRFYGYSPINLPLYEEDAQKHTLQIGFDETVVLLPFGRGGAETLKIEITPTLLSVSKTDESSRQLKINFDKQIPSGEIFIEASKTPHHFEVEAVLTADGQTIARGSADCWLEEEKEIVLLPISDSEFGNQPFIANLTVNKFTRTRPADLVDISFNFYHANKQSNGENRAMISTGAGVSSLGGNLTYSLKDKNLPGDKNYELKFKIRLADAERTD